MEHDYKDVGVRVAPGAAAELPEQLPRWRKCRRIVGNNPCHARQNDPCYARQDNPYQKPDGGYRDRIHS